MGATLPVDEHHPAVNEETYLITAKFEKTYRKTYYDGSSDRKTKTWYTAEKTESKSAIQDTIDSFVTDEPEWVKVGATVDLI